jgi:ketosteroid isomerase-like protein
VIGQAERNLQHVKTALEILDAEGGQALLDRFDDLHTTDFAWEPGNLGAAEPGTYHGFEGFRQFWGEFHGGFESFELRHRHFLPVGDGVLVTARLHARGRASGVDVDSEWAGLFRLRDGKIASCQSFASHAEALTAAGALYASKGVPAA